MEAAGNTGRKIAATSLKAGEKLCALFGPRDISYAEVMHILGERIGGPDLQHIKLLTTIWPRRSRPVRTRENTTPIRFEDFVSELVRAYHAS